MDRKWKNLKFFKHVSPSLDHVYRKGNVVPPRPLVYKALELTKFDDVKVVIIGMDPYPTKGHAHGLAFSVRPEVTIPPSLRRIFDEYEDDLGFPRPRTGDLTQWALNGVLLLNTCLTCEEGKPGSHINKYNWEKLTYEIVRKLSSDKQGLVFVLWGAHASQFATAIEEGNDHLVISSGHPSPLNRNKDTPFLGTRPFSRTCTHLNIDPCKLWRLP